MIRAARRVGISQPSLSNTLFASKPGLVERFSSVSAIRPSRAKWSQQPSRMSVGCVWKMNFEQWKAAAGAVLHEQYGINPARIPNEIWRQLYLQNFEPREAARRIEVIYVNARP